VRKPACGCTFDIARRQLRLRGAPADVRSRHAFSYVNAFGHDTDDARPFWPAAIRIEQALTDVRSSDAFSYRCDEAGTA
jgi:hypothetical protein